MICTYQLATIELRLIIVELFNGTTLTINSLALTRLNLNRLAQLKRFFNELTAQIIKWTYHEPLKL